MTWLQKGSPLYDQIFGSAGDLSTPFESRFPTYGDLTDGFTDPSNAVNLSDERSQNGNQAKDMRSGTQRMVWDLVADIGSDAPVNLPTAMLGGVKAVVQSQSIETLLTSDQVRVVFPVDGTAIADAAEVAQSLGGKGALNAAVGVGLLALGVEVPVVGTIVAAIIGLALGLKRIVTNWKEKQDLAEAEIRAKFFESLPPLQVGGSETDSALVNNVLRPALRTRDLTSIYMPRFEGPWVGQPRDGGYAFAQGQTINGSDNLQQNVELFQPVAGALGVIPGTSRVTAVIQVSLQTDESVLGSEDWVSFRSGVGKDPRTLAGAWRRVQDTGLYYPATGRLAGNLWDLARRRGNPLKYRLDAVRMHAAWRAWAENGLRFIRDTCYGWYAKFKSGDGTIDADANLDGFFGTAVYYAVGAWGSQVSGGTTYHPTYTDFPRPTGYIGDQMAADWCKAYGFPESAVWNGRSGAWLPIVSGETWHDAGMGENYNRGLNIRGTLSNLQRQQLGELGTTLVSAYCSVHDAAFVGDSDLEDRLLKMRGLLLDHRDRFKVNLADVRPDEPGVPGKANWQSWRAQLVAAGVPEAPLEAGDVLELDPSDRPQKKPSYCEAGIVCDVPEDDDPEPGFTPMPADPWEPPKSPPKRHGRPDTPSSGGGALAVAGGLGVFGLGTALVMAARRRHMKSRNFSAGRTRR